LLETIRRLERLDDDRAFRVVPPEADDIEAVRFMTIHACKGLEFRVVHLPVVASRYLPVALQRVRCPAPLGLERLELSKQDHDAEEECLFFVALSRARDVLSISRSDRYTANQTCGPSKFLSDLGSVLPQVRRLQQRWTNQAAPELSPQPTKSEYEERHLQLYDDCPARYRYEVVDSLHGPRDASAYLKFHGCVRQVIAWLTGERQTGRSVTANDATERLRTEWDQKGPEGGYAPVYWRAAEEMVRRSAEIIAVDDGAPIDQPCRVMLGNRAVVATPDRATQQPDGSIIVQRVRTGRKTKNEPEKAIWAFLEAAGRAMFPGRSLHLEAFYPATGERVLIMPKDRDKALAMYEAAIAGIERGDFTPNPSRNCPSCQFYFICTSEIPK
jgi:DNA helicase II / ATP-dependent DNA helicase PcrA